MLSASSSAELGARTTSKTMCSIPRFGLADAGKFVKISMLCDKNQAAHVPKRSPSSRRGSLDSCARYGPIFAASARVLIRSQKEQTTPHCGGQCAAKHDSQLFVQQCMLMCSRMQSEVSDFRRGWAASHQLCDRSQFVHCQVCDGVDELLESH